MSAASEAIFKAVVITAFVEGRAELTESKVVSELIELTPQFATLDNAFELSVQARLLLDERGVEDALEAILAPVTTAADRDLAFRLCARVMMSDGQTEGDEALALGTLQEHFALSHEHVRAVLDEEAQRRKGKS